MFKIFYRRVLGINYYERNINYLSENILRKDSIYELMVQKYYNNKKALKKILLISCSLNLSTSTELAFLSYVYALNHKWISAINVMNKVIELEGGKNVDSWIDYGHFLRKIDKFEELSNNLLLNLNYYIYEYTMCNREGINIIDFLKRNRNISN